MKKNYEMPDVDAVLFGEEDVIITSGGTTQDFDDLGEIEV